ncbi:MAG TPA: DUF1858 domain-containing protein [bacterium]|nr:DUF1858 domain-containing protein [bacterium]HPN44070.1 DUF1858 domain-containing protein [bacterium]
MDKNILITPQTKIAELLASYPQLEEVLIDMAPQFRKLQNPVLRKTIARITSLQQAAMVGKVPLQKMINTLRSAVGQEKLDSSSPETEQTGGQPAWFNPAKIVKKLDARAMLERGEHPVGIVVQEVQTLQAGEIYELIAPFEPAPLIDKVKEKGLAAWVNKTSEDVYYTYFCRE